MIAYRIICNKSVEFRVNRAPRSDTHRAVATLRDTDPFDDDQWPRRCTEVAVLAPGHLRLRIALLRSEAICDVYVEEHADRVEVEVLACRAPGRRQHDVGEPPTVEIYLQTALDGRAVIDLCDGATVARSGP
jgi:hypothetical protein